MSASRRIAVFGASGFVGAAAVRALGAQNCVVTPVMAPRLLTRARDEGSMLDELRRMRTTIGELADFLAGFDAVVNAAGVANALDPAGDSLYGANALLPGVLGAAVGANNSLGSPTRLLHVSSAAVQGRRGFLTESSAVAPFSPYSHTKALGESLCSVGSAAAAVRFRPTSVHGPRRSLTRKLVRFLSSPLASVAGSGDYPTPQVHVDNVGHAIALLAMSDLMPPNVVLQPSEHFTAVELVRILGDREPWHVPAKVAHGMIAATSAAGRIAAPIRGTGRRLEILWRGQDQARSWLEGHGWNPVAGREEWRRLRCA